VSADLGQGTAVPIQPIAVVVAQALRLRDAPTLEANALLVMPRGTEVQILDFLPTGWTEISVQARGGAVTGWCLRRMLDASRNAPMPDFPTAQVVLWDWSAHYANRVSYKMGAKATNLGGTPPCIDCSGWVAFLLLAALRAQNTEARENVFDPDDVAVLDTYSDRIILEIEARTPQLLTGAEITQSTVTPGMAIGLAETHQDWEANAERVRGINHIVLLVRRPSDNEMFVSESRGPERIGGVRLTPVSHWLAQQSQWIAAGRAFAADPMALADPYSDWVQKARQARA
jgi:hypothetical protein